MFVWVGGQIEVSLLGDEVMLDEVLREVDEVLGEVLCHNGRMIHKDSAQMFKPTQNIK